MSSMTIKRAIGLLTTLRHTCAAAEGCTGEALDVAIDLLQHNLPKHNIDSIIKAVERETGVSELEMTHRGRQREFAEARAIVCWLAYHYAPMTLTSIGRRLGRDHPTVIHYNKMVDNWLDEPRLNLRGARITTKLIRELEEDDD